MYQYIFEHLKLNRRKMQHKILVPFISLQTKRIILSRTRKLIPIKQEYLLEDRAGVKIEGQTAGAGSGGRGDVSRGESQHQSRSVQVKSIQSHKTVDVTDCKRLLGTEWLLVYMYSRKN